MHTIKRCHVTQKTSLAVMDSGLAVVRSALSSQGGQPAAWYFQSNVPVKEFLSRCLDVEGFFQLEFFGSSSLVNHPGVLPLDGMVVLPGMFCHS